MTQPIAADLDIEVLDPAFETVLAAERFDGAAHVLDDGDQPEGADVRLAEGENFARRTGGDELGEHLAPVVVRIPDLAVQLAVGEQAGAAFTELHVGFRIEHGAAPKAPGIVRALAHHLAALQDDRAEPHLRQHQRREQAARAGADHHRPHRPLRRGAGDEAVGHVRRARDVTIPGEALEEARLVGHLDVERVGERDRRLLARIGRAAEYREADEVAFPDAQPLDERRPDRALVVPERQLEVGQAQHGAPRGAVDAFLCVLAEDMDIGTKAMKIAVIGAGNVGRALGTGWAKAGHAIVFGVRDVNKPELKSLCAQIGASAALSAEAARQGDVVVLALPWTTAEGAVKSLGDLTGKIVVDTMNPLAMKDGALGLERGFTTSAGETVAAWLPSAKVVKTFNQVGANMMTEGRRFATPPVMFLAGDDDAAKRVVSGLTSEIGFEPLDAGGLKQARILEPLAMVWINQSLARGFGRDWAFGVVRPKG